MLGVLDINGALSGCQSIFNIVGIPTGCQGTLTLLMHSQNRGWDVEEIQNTRVGSRQK